MEFELKSPLFSVSLTQAHKSFAITRANDSQLEWKAPAKLSVRPCLHWRDKSFLPETAELFSRVRFFQLGSVVAVEI